MLFVNNDQSQFRQRREYRQPRAEHDARGARLRGNPVLQPLAFVQAAVQADHVVCGKRPRTVASSCGVSEISGTSSSV